MAEFQFHVVELIKTAVLGTGSYGVVCKAKCDELQCAAKLLHNALFQVNDPGATILMRRFEQECQFLSGIKHPHIIQYLGVHRDPDSGLPSLLMELAEENLTRYLERSQEQLPYFTQVNLCQGVALALAYLHSHQIIHRDLSSNNVLMVGSKVKVTDFGMSKLLSVNPHFTPLTKCPGAWVYMPPEALKELPVYTTKLDCFSFGVLVLQILTQQFPDPGLGFKNIEIQDARIPMGRVDVPVAEIERRHNHISLVDPNHPLLHTALQCLSDSDQKRPSAHTICQTLGELKESRRYTESLEVAQSIRDDHKKVIVELRQQNEEQSIRIQLLRSDLKAKNCLIGERDAIIETRQQEIQHLRQQIQEIEHAMKAREKENMCIQEREKQQQLQCSEQQNAGKMKGDIRLKWTKCEGEVAKSYMIKGSSAVNGNLVYFNSDNSESVYAYSSDSQTWTSLPSFPYPQTTLAIVNNLLTGIGGWCGRPTNVLLSLTNKKWTKHYPPMPTSRWDVAAACSKKFLIVAGGGNEYEMPCYVTTVEIMNTETYHWFTASGLPKSFDRSSLVICGKYIYSLGGEDKSRHVPSRLVWRCSLADLAYHSQLATSPDAPPLMTKLKKTFGFHREVPVEMPQPLKPDKSSSEHAIWESVAPTPLFWSTYVSIGGQLLAIGGNTKVDTTYGINDDTHSSDVYAYDLDTNTWKATDSMLTPRSFCLAAVLLNDVLVVVGGKSSGAIPVETLKEVEIATLV